MRTIEECRKIIARGEDDLLTPCEMKLIDDELKKLKNFIDETDNFIKSLKEKNTTK